MKLKALVPFTLANGQTVAADAVVEVAEPEAATLIAAKKAVAAPVMGATTPPAKPVEKHIHPMYVGTKPPSDVPYKELKVDDAEKPAVPKKK